MEHITFNGHMVAIMVLMEAPTIMVGLLLMTVFEKNKNEKSVATKKVLHHSLTNGSVLLIIGLLASEAQAK